MYCMFQKMFFEKRWEGRDCSGSEWAVIPGPTISEWAVPGPKTSEWAVPGLKTSEWALGSTRAHN